MDNEKSQLDLPIPTGPYSVGIADVMTELSSEGCFFRLYYPTDYQDITKHQAQFPNWMPRKEYVNALEQFFDFAFQDLPVTDKWKIGNAKISALWHAPLASEEDGLRFPLIVYSHGLGSNRTMYSTVCCEMASHGFIVAAIEHRDKSACYSYYYNKVGGSSGDSNAGTIKEVPVKHQMLKQGQKQYPLRNQQLHRRITECVKTLRLMESIDSGKKIDIVIGQNFDLSMFKGRIDLSRVSAMGHSFGGATVIGALAAMKDFSGSVHQSQTDFTFLVTGELAARMQACGDVDPYLCIEINNALCLAFLRDHLSIQSKQSFKDAMAHYREGILIGTNVKVEETRSQL